MAALAAQARKLVEPANKALQDVLVAPALWRLRLVTDLRRMALFTEYPRIAVHAHTSLLLARGSLCRPQLNAFDVTVSRRSPEVIRA